MTEISINEKRNQLKISNYNGNSEKTFRYKFTSVIFPQELNFFREANNHAYVEGKIVYKGDCKNNLVISPYIDNSLRDVRNAFVFAGDSFIEVSPIYDLKEVIEKAKFQLSRNRIKYNIPFSVLTRERLNKKDLGNLERVLRESYGIISKEIVPITLRSKNEGIFYLNDRTGNKYIFKFKNKDKNRAELLSEVAESVPDIFPKNYPRIDSQKYTVELGDGFYGLESFVEGETKERNLEYFSLIGENIGKLHQEFEHFLRNHPKTDEFLGQSHSSLSESNLISLYLDIFLDNSDEFLLSELERLVNRNFSSKATSSQKTLIHRDLNQSNILWVNDSPIIIDSESMGITEKINEFAPALLLQGNRNRPNYVPNSMDFILRFYHGLSPDEELVLPDLLKYSLIRYYVVRNIRRNLGESTELERLKNDLNQVNLKT